MENNMIGSQITKFRKAAGITQEELGRSVGVSTQAVSRWECGGAPDVTLLPAIADKLGVTVDALFGREGGEAADINEAVKKHFSSVPYSQYHDKINRMIWAGIQGTIFVKDMPFMEHCTDDAGRLIHSRMETDSGIYFGVSSEEMAFSTVCPKPADGYAAYFADCDAYRKFFASLAIKGTLETILYLRSQKDRYFTLDLLAKNVGLEVPEMEKVLKNMQENHLVVSLEIGTLNGRTVAYAAEVSGEIVPFLYLSRCILEDTSTNFLGCNARTAPLL